MSTSDAEWVEALAEEVDAGEVVSLSPDTPAIESHRILNTAAAVPVAGDDRWDLSALNQDPGVSPVALVFTTPRATGVVYHPERIETLKRIAYLLINRRVPATVAMAPDSKPGSPYVPAPSVYQTLRALRRFMEWAEAIAEAEVLADCTPALMDQYANALAQRDIEDQSVRASLYPLWRLSQMAKWLPSQDQLPVPSWKWDTPGTGRVQVDPDGSAFAVIDPEVLDPLLTWSLAYVRDFSRDLLPARDLVRNRLASARPVSEEEVGAWMRDYLQQTGHRIPLDPQLPRPTPALHYLSYLSGIDYTSLRVWWDTHRKRRPLIIRDRDLRCDLGVTVTATLHDGLPWADDIEFYDVSKGNQTRGVNGARALRHLQTACFIVLAYLSGCRPQELRTLEREGCIIEVPAPEPGGITGYLVRGTLRKGQESGGTSEKWATIKPGADAAHLASRLAEDSRWLFPGPDGKPISTVRINARIDDFIKHVNNLPLQDRLPGAFRIGGDQEPDVTTRQFRRTASWNILNQPDGEFALGNQYKQASTTLGRDGYASMRNAGVTKMMDADAAAVHRATLVSVSEAILNGAGVSGPSADRLIAAAQLAQPLRAVYVAPAALAEILSDADAQVYDNPSQHSLCVYVPARAKCAGTDDAPDRGSCVRNCTCHARTDIQMDVLAKEAERNRIEAESPLTPEPLRVRLLQVAEQAEQDVDQHHRERRYLPIVEVTNQAGGVSDGD